MNSLVDSWKNADVFASQLALNEKELDNYPAHWNLFLEAVSVLDPKPQTMLDIGCGVGTFHELCRRHYPTLKYTGADYSSDAIELAKNKWGGDHWDVRDYKDLTTEDAKKYDLLHAGALLDVLPNGDDALSFLLELGFKYLILGRVKFTRKGSHFIEYDAYDKIPTYAYSHNLESLMDSTNKAGYRVMLTGEMNSCTVILKKSP